MRIRSFFILTAFAAVIPFVGGCQRRLADDGSGDVPAAKTTPSTADIIEHGPTVLVMLDNSGSSPALDQALMDSVAPMIAERIKAMPPGTLVSVATVGDATVTSSTLSLRIQARGQTANAVAGKLERYLKDFPAATKGKEQGRSDLVGGFAAAAGLLNKKSNANQIYAVTDLVEYSAVADCTRGFKCKLPVKPSFDLAQARVHVYGVGQGLPSDRAMQLTEDWRQFLIRANAKDLDLRRF